MLKENKRSTGLKGHVGIKDSSLTSCQKGTYLHINSLIIEQIKINNGRGKQPYKCGYVNSHNKNYT